MQSYEDIHIFIQFSAVESHVIQYHHNEVHHYKVSKV
jgi:hypothetical protein